MAALKYAQRYFRSAHHLSLSERAALSRTLREMEASSALPGPEDVATIIPPSMHAWRRRVGASDRYVYFVVGPDGGATVVGVGGLL